MASTKTIACVLGDMDLVRPLGLAGVSCAVMARPGAAPRYSRFTRTALNWADAWEHEEELVETLVRFGSTEREPPVLFYESDGELLVISRHRERLRQFFRFVIADAALVEDLVDKARFQDLAKRLALPVPAARHLQPSAEVSADVLDLSFPVIVKPLVRHPRIWKTVAKTGKAMRVETPEELRRLWPMLAASGVDFLAQELIPGPETLIESYHVYVDERGETVGEFSGRKIRTYPREYGDSCALVITDEADVLELGRELVKRLGLRGVAKFDFKRAPDGRLLLLEVNPRFSLWHHLGALAGVNLPALVYADATGLARPAVTSARPGVRWCRPWQDARAARQWGVPLTRWLPWALSCEAKRVLAWDDPMAFVRAALWRAFPWPRRRAAKQEHRLFRPRVEAARGSLPSAGE